MLDVCHSHVTFLLLYFEMQQLLQLRFFTYVSLVSSCLPLFFFARHRPTVPGIGHEKTSFSLYGVTHVLEIGAVKGFFRIKPFSLVPLYLIPSRSSCHCPSTVDSLKT